MANIFISYSRKDIKFVEKLAQDLDGKGYDVWFDLTDIDGGDRWAEEIQAGIEGSDYFIIVVSKNSIESEWVQKEYLYASTQDTLIIPLLLEKCKLPIWLVNIQYIEMLSRLTYEEGFQKIIAVIDGNTPLPDVAKKKNSFKRFYPFIIGGVIALALALISFFTLGSKSPPATATETPSVTQQPVTPTETEAPTKEPTATETKTETPLPPTATNEPSATPFLTDFTDDSGAEMVLIPAGNYIMGNDRGASDEKPTHIVTISNFYLDKYEVTNAQYRACVLDMVCGSPSITTFFFDENYADHPVVFVDWNDAGDFCSWRDARLPSEAEWEKAARGSKWSAYPWGDTFYGTFLNFCDLNCGNEWKNLSFNDGYVITAPVGSYEGGQSSYGIHDMSGNVTEWVSDWYSSRYYKDSPGIDPLGPDDGIHRVLRGGSWYNEKEDVQTFTREHLSPNSSFNYIGFRCARDVP